jgi:hypothetical protein
MVLVRGVCWQFASILDYPVDVLIDENMDFLTGLSLTLVQTLKKRKSTQGYPNAYAPQCSIKCGEKPLRVEVTRAWDQSIDGFPEDEFCRCVKELSRLAKRSCSGDITKSNHLLTRCLKRGDPHSSPSRLDICAFAKIGRTRSLACSDEAPSELNIPRPKKASVAGNPAGSTTNFFCKRTRIA